MLDRDNALDGLALWWLLTAMVQCAASQNITSTQNIASSRGVISNATAITTVLTTSVAQSDEPDDCDNLSWCWDLKATISAISAGLTLCGLLAALIYFCIPHRRSAINRRTEDMLAHARSGLWEEVKRDINGGSDCWHSMARSFGCCFTWLCCFNAIRVHYASADDDGNTIFHHAARLDKVRSLYKELFGGVSSMGHVGLGERLKNKNGDVPIVSAIRQRNLRSLRYYLSIDWYPPVMTSISFSDESLRNILRNSGANHEDGYTFLHALARYVFHEPIIRRFVQVCASNRWSGFSDLAFAKDSDGNTFMHLAFEYNNRFFIKYLLEDDAFIRKIFVSKSNEIRRADDSLKVSYMIDMDVPHLFEDLFDVSRQTAKEQLLKYFQDHYFFISPPEDSYGRVLTWIRQAVDEANDYTSRREEFEGRREEGGLIEHYHGWESMYFENQYGVLDVSVIEETKAYIAYTFKSEAHLRSYKPSTFKLLAALNDLRPQYKRIRVWEIRDESIKDLSLVDTFQCSPIDGSGLPSAALDLLVNPSPKLINAGSPLTQCQKLRFYEKSEHCEPPSDYAIVYPSHTQWSRAGLVSIENRLQKKPLDIAIQNDGVSPFFFEWMLRAADKHFSNLGDLKESYRLLMLNSAESDSASSIMKTKLLILCDYLLGCDQFASRKEQQDLAFTSTPFDETIRILAAILGNESQQSNSSSEILGGIHNPSVAGGGVSSQSVV